MSFPSFSSPTPLPNAFLQMASPSRVAPQVTSSLASLIPPNASISDLPLITWRNKRYVVEEQLSRKRGRGRSSWIKNHGVFLVEVSSTLQPMSAYWCCQRCDDKGRPEFFSVLATSSAQEHLRKYVYTPLT
ncbi:transposase-like protein [Colletotrichum sojae]|uniref:Transposase-like protein n=1 Tax=Colletotrichum sojae TaxID=2175907 RepID=A0A8H6MHQ8_9PEZI|nr:transposase-like protein [Colletotrichum sojae]